MMIKPKALKPGQTIGIAAPADAFGKKAFFAGVEKIKSWGFRVKYGRSIFKRGENSAAADYERAGEINRMFRDPQVRAVFCAKAGYGTARLIEYLDAKAISRHPKIFIGYSDITVLLTYLNSVHKMVAFHGPVVAGEIRQGMPERAERRLLSLLTGEEVPELLKNDFRVMRAGYAEGRLAGGNLSRLINTLGTPFEINTADKILFLEDVGIHADDLDAMLTHLKTAGKLRRVRGIILGYFSDYSGRNIGAPVLERSMRRALKDVPVPVIFRAACGHGPVNLTLPLGVKTVLDTAKHGVFLKEKPVI